MGMVHYCEKLMGVVVFAKVQGPVKSENPRTRRLIFKIVKPECSLNKYYRVIDVSKLNKDFFAKNVFSHVTNS